MTDEHTENSVATPDDRDVSADSRDQTSVSHDKTADERDDMAALRDTRADARDEAVGRIDVPAAADRNAAQRDRRSAKGDRKHAADDRDAASIDRFFSAVERTDLLHDELTGCYRRAAGFSELEREISKAERTEHPFVLTFIDIDGLKTINDTSGHDAGDEALRQVVRCIRGVVRDYDILVRYGGDEFLCGMADVHLADVIERFDQAKVALRNGNHASITIGVVERQSGEGLTDLTSRADAAMYDNRQRRHNPIPLPRFTLNETDPPTPPALH